jgi:nicotinamidase-related amidase
MSCKRILLDIETQRDFFAPGGSCYSPAASKAARNVYRLFAWARAESIPVISTVLRVRPNEIGPLADVPHCVDGTNGEAKLAKTLLSRRVNLGLLNTTDLPGRIFGRYRQVIFEKRHPDILAHARAERLITELPEATFVLCGAGLAAGIAQAAIGLRNRGFSVIVADDAVVHTGPEPPEMALLRMRAKGVVFAPTAKILAPRHRPRRPFRQPQAAERQAF